MDPKSTYKVLIVDDMKRAGNEIPAKLRKIGFPCEIIFLCPEFENQDFGGCSVPLGEAFDSIDLALVDMELFGTSGLEYRPEDLRGWTEFLPYLRQEAPWLPVIGYSQLF